MTRFTSGRTGCFSGSGGPDILGDPVLPLDQSLQQ